MKTNKIIKNRVSSKVTIIKHIINFALMLSVLSFNANAIVIRHDVQDQEYLKLGQKYQASIVQIEGCTGTLIDQNWLLTAAHCVSGREDMLFSANHINNTYRIESVIVHPNYDVNDISAYDIALVQLKEPITNGKPAKIYSLDNEKGKQVVFVGKGVSGNGRDGLTKNDFKLRGATNTIVEQKDKVIGFKFDSPQNATDLEGISGPGDSGGPAFVNVDSQLYVVGVSSYQEPDSYEEAHYGVKEYYTRVSAFHQWVTSVMKNTKHAVSPPSHALIDAIKANDSKQLIESTTNKLFSNQLLMNEAFYQAVINNRVELANQLINKGARTKSVKIFNMSLYEFSLLSGQNDFFEMLVGKAKYDEKLYGNQSNVLPLLIASFSEDLRLVEKVKRALSQGANINAKDNSGNTALHVAIWSTNNIALIRYLVESGANVNATTQNGDTPLMDAAYLDKPEFLSYLLLSGADTTLKNFNGNSALDLTQNEASKELIKSAVMKSIKSPQSQ